MSYAGIVIGGPWAGKSYEGRTARVNLSIGASVAQYPTGQGVETRNIAPEHFEYVYTELFGACLWVPRGWSQDEITKEVFSNYRPLALRELSVHER